MPVMPPSNPLVSADRTCTGRSHRGRDRRDPVEQRGQREQRHRASDDDEQRRSRNVARKIGRCDDRQRRDWEKPQVLFQDCNGTSAPQGLARVAGNDRNHDQRNGVPWVVDERQNAKKKRRDADADHAFHEPCESEQDKKNCKFSQIGHGSPCASLAERCLPASGCIAGLDHFQQPVRVARSVDGALAHEITPVVVNQRIAEHAQVIRIPQCIDRLQMRVRRSRHDRHVPAPDCRRPRANAPKPAGHVTKPRRKSAPVFP